MAYRRRDFAPRHAMSKDHARAHLCGLLLDSDGSVAATDGCILAVVTPSNPEPRTAALLAGEELELSMLRVKHAAARASRDAKMGSKTLAKEGAVVEISGDEAIAKEFPQYRTAIPSGPAKASIMLDLALLKSLLAVAEEYLGGERKSDRVIKLEIRGECDPLVITGTSHDNGTLTALIMPVRQ